jgi:sugar lactone lactonase YvrE
MPLLHPWLRLLLAAVLTLWGCMAPALGPTAATASLRVRLADDDAPYRLAFLPNPDWRRAVATLGTAGGTTLTAEAPRGTAIEFTSITPGSGFTLSVKLYRPTPEGGEAEVRTLERTNMTIVPGVNTLALGSFTTTHPTPTAAAARAPERSYVTSLLQALKGAQFNDPKGVAVDASGNVYVADYANHRIRKVSPTGVVTTLAGSTQGFADGTGTSAKFSNPYGVAVDASGTVYVADSGNHRIRKVSPTGVVTTLAGFSWGFADGTGTSAQFTSPGGVAVDASGNIFVADRGNNRIRKVSPTGVVTTLAGSTQGFADGTGTSAQFSNPYGVAVDAGGNAYVADYANHRIRKVSPTGVVTTLAGSSANSYADGTGTSASFNYPFGVFVDASGNVYVADSANNRIRKVSPTGVVTTLAGGSGGFADGTGTSAKFSNPYGVAMDTSGNLYVADLSNNRIRKVSTTGVVTTLAGSGTRGSSDGSALAGFAGPNCVAIDAAGNLYVAEKDQHRISKILPDGTLTTLAGGSAAGFADGTGTSAQFTNPRGVAVDASGTVYVADHNNHRIRKVSPTGVVTTLAGSGTNGYSDGTGTSASFNYPMGVAVDASGTIYVADYNNNRIRKVSPTGVVTTLAGSGAWSFGDGTGTSASFNYPTGVAVDASGNVYVADSSNHRIRKVSPTGVVTTLAGGGTSGFGGFADGTGTSARFNYPAGVAVDASGYVYVADSSNHLIRKVSPTGFVTTLAGTYSWSGGGGFADGPGTSAQFAWPTGVAVDGNGHVYVADQNNDVLRWIR